MNENSKPPNTRRNIVLLFLLLFSGRSLYAQEAVYDLDYRLTNLLNIVVPGTAQFKMNQPEEGFFYLISIPFVYGGYFFFLEQVLRGDVDITSFQFHASLFSIKFGETLQSHSMWAYFRDYTDLHIQNPKRRGRESPWELMLSPFKSKNLFSWDVMPFFPLTTLLTFRNEDYMGIYRFFEKEHIDIWGIKTNPYAAALLFLTYFAVLNDFVAVSEETLFRGLLLEQNDLVFSSILFGSMHLSSLMLFPEIDATAIMTVSRQVLFATLFGFWQGFTTQNNTYNFEKAIALHFWHNTLNMFLSTLADIGNYTENNGDNPSMTTFYIPLFFYSY